MFLVSLWTGNIQDGFQQTFNLASTRRRSRVLAVDRPLDRLRRAGHDPRVRARVPAGLRHRVPRRRLQEPAAVPGHRAVLHELPAADASRGRSSFPTTGSSSGRSRTIGIIPDDFRLLATPVAVIAGHHLQLPAVHDPAAVRRAREDRPAAPRGGRGPVRRTVAAAGHDRRWLIVGGVLGARRRRRHGLRAAHRSAIPGADRRRHHRDLPHQRGVHPGRPCRWPCRASSPGRCWCSSRRSATTSTPSCWATRSR